MRTVATQRRIFSGPGVAEAETRSGRVSGFIAEDVYTFLGIPYGADTGGVNRFLPPRPPASWVGARPCLTFGPVSPQPPRAGPENMTRAYQEEGFLLQWRDGVQSEDCLNLNIWTPTLDRKARLPVMVWLHGGHFSFGSSGELPATHGEELSRRGEVIVVSVNHRLNIFGYMPALPLGENYASTGNAGMLDIVLALEWVRDNIEAFGGDPGCVTIFGQSGGGAKVTTLMGMPAARGLFHRAIVQSNIALRQCGAEQADRVRAAIRAEIGGVDAERRLLEMQSERLMRFGMTVMQRVAIPENPARRNRRVRWEPVVDGINLPGHAFDPEAPEFSAEVPLLVGTTLHEFSSGIGVPDPEGLTDRAVAEEFSRTFGEQGPAVLALFRSKYPDITPFELRSRAYGATVRECAVIQARRKACQGQAPAYLYWFRWRTPALGGRPGVFHNAELPFVFANAHRCVEWTTGSPEAIGLAARVADAWIGFARSGDPNHSGLPEWLPVSAAGCETMILDTDCTLDFGSDQDERNLAGPA